MAIVLNEIERKKKREGDRGGERVSDRGQGAEREVRNGKLEFTQYWNGKYAIGKEKYGNNIFYFLPCLVIDNYLVYILYSLDGYTIEASIM